MIEFIKSRIRNMGFDMSQILIEPYTITLPEEIVHSVYPADNEFLFLYDISNYSKEFTITDDLSQIKSDEFIIDGKVPSGLVEMRGNIRVETFDDEPLTLMFYKVITGNKILKKS